MKSVRKLVSSSVITIVFLAILLTVATLVVAGLDSGRFRWSPNFPWTLALVGVAFTVIGSDYQKVVRCRLIPRLW